MGTGGAKIRSVELKRNRRNWVGRNGVSRLVKLDDTTSGPKIVSRTRASFRGVCNPPHYSE